MDKKLKLGIAGLVALFGFFVGFRVFFQKGAKLLDGLFPWNWIALAVILALLCFYAYKATRKNKNDDNSENA